MNRYVCIHGHFYQPPRENPWLEAIELQDSAYPYHDWNERIMAECYAPNASARILDERERIEQIVNNYSRISFNFGPTLLSWMEEKAARVYRAILDADAESRSRFSGHGSALAQVYNHMILPLANARDRRTQVLWGVRDFERRFGRAPEGMWLPETAADLPTLDVLAELGLRFTVLAPSQAARVRRRSGGRWRDVTGDRIDPTRAYRLRLPSQRTIDLFFYDGPISRAVAFEGLLRNGEDFARRIVGGFSTSRDWPQLVNIATDGETYGHHQHRGDMALAYALRYIEANELARLTNYGEYLERHPPTHDVEVIENTSWSCVHGVERWRSDCGCRSGARPTWQQAWRAPLREALDVLRDATAGPFEEKAHSLFADPWQARDDYVDVVLDRSPESVGRFFGQHASRELPGEDRVSALRLLELQRHAMLMYTSCGWFFDEISGIETVQVIQYAGRVLQLAHDLFGDSFEAPFLETLSRAPSNLPEVGNGRTVYERYVRPATVDLIKVGAHYAVSSLFEKYGDSARIYSYTVDREDFRELDAGRARLGLGRARFTSRTTTESELLTFGVLQFGGHNVNGGVRAFRGEEEYRSLVQSVVDAFSSADLTDVIRRLDDGFGRDILSLKLLFRDEQRKILDLILQSTLTNTEALLRQAYDANVPLMRFLAALNTPLPSVFHAIAEFVLNAQLRQALDDDDPDRDRIERLLGEAAREQVVLAQETIEFALRRRIESLALGFAEDPDDEGLERLRRAVVLASRMPFPVELWEVQNTYFTMLQNVYPERLERSRKGDADARIWAERFAELGDLLFVKVPERPDGPDS
jgi:alpha-amylase/alpha-mannosidase (GH57 family)